MYSKRILVIFVIFANFHAIFGQGETLTCTYATVSSVYTCNLKLNNTRGLNNFATITGNHLSGKNDNLVLSVASVAGSLSPNIPSIICDRFRNVQKISMNNIGIKNILIENRSSFTYCTYTNYIEICNDNIDEIDYRSFTSNTGLLDLRLWNLGLTTLPENVFNSLINLERLYLHKNKFETLPTNLFRYLKRLQVLNLQENLIVDLNYKWFDTLISLKSLYLESNKIVDLPTDIFRELTDLETITLSHNNLTILHSDPFGYLPKLKYFSLINCQLDAIDQDLIDNTGAIQFALNNNYCVNETITDNSATRYSMRIILAECFANYVDLMGQTTTTISAITSTTSNPNLPPNCIGGNIDARVCALEDKNEKLIESVEDLAKQNQELEDQNKAFASLLENMQSQIDELRNRPCSCL
ncbi:leucine-rich repeat-containing protein 15-like [Chironomus tepperi]|uniref:leucine-rich repeat-containing protein 15-like n=1 Tax=Chironomus tepperi TaxID=113505 RepID=UPI00391F967B